MKKMILLSITAFICSAGFMSCSKESKPESDTKQTLMAHTWQMQTVTQYSSGTPYVTYQRGAANNEDDLSMIRQTYKSNGSIQYVDEFGESGSNATYQLLDNDRKIRISYSGLTITGENLVVAGNLFAYTIKYSTTDSARFVFSPF